MSILTSLSDKEKEFVDFLDTNPPRFAIVNYVNKYNKECSQKEVERLLSILRAYEEKNSKF